MAKSADKRSCSVDGCEKLEGPKLAIPLCWGHYQRARRGNVSDYPIQDYGVNTVALAAPPLAPQVLALLERAIKTNYQDRRADVYAPAMREIVYNWLERAEKDTHKAFLKGHEAAESPVASASGYRRVGSLSLPEAKINALKAAAKRLGITVYRLVAVILDDWYLYWKDTDAPPEVGPSLSPYGAAKAATKDFSPDGKPFVFNKRRRA